MIRATALALAVLALGVTAHISCTSSDDGSEKESRVTELTNPRDAVSTECMLALHNAKNFHHIADVYLKESRIDEATEAVRKILSIKFPDECDHDVVLDARARLAKLLTTQGKTGEAMKEIDKGLASARGDSFFLANLHTVKGEVHEAIAVTLQDKDPEAAKAEHRKAIKEYATSIEINERLQKRLMGEAP